MSGGGFEKEFAPDILVDGIPCDLIVEEPDHPGRFCDATERHCREAGNGGRILFDIGPYWPYAEYVMALMLRAGKEFEELKSAMHEITADENTTSK